MRRSSMTHGKPNRWHSHASEMHFGHSPFTMQIGCRGFNVLKPYKYRIYVYRTMIAGYRKGCIGLGGWVVW